MRYPTRIEACVAATLRKGPARQAGRQTEKGCMMKYPGTRSGITALMTAVGLLASLPLQAEISGDVDTSLNGNGFKLLEFRAQSMAGTENRNWNHPVLSAAAHADGSVLVLGSTKDTWEECSGSFCWDNEGEIAVIMQYDEHFEQGISGETGTQFIYSGVFANDANKALALGGGADRWLHRYHLNGTFDTGFADQGVFNDTQGLFGSGHAKPATPMTYDSDGRLLVYTAGVGLARVLVDGSPDSSFGSDGLAAAAESGAGVDIAQAGDGAYYVMLNSGDIIRYTASGAPDMNFGEAGVLGSGTSSSRVSGIAAMPDNGVVTVVNNSQGSQARLVHFSPTGEEVNASPVLSETGWPLADGTNMIQLGYGGGANLMTLDNGQVLLSIGWQGRTPAWAIYGYQLFGLFNSDLTPDTGFDGDNGLVIHEAIPTTNSSNPVTSRLLTVDNKGRILLVTHTNSQGNDNITDGMATWAVARLMGSWDGESSGSGPEDTTPDAFGFPPKTDVALSAQVTSDPAIIAGIDAPASVTVTNGEYAIGCSGSFTSAGGAISSGQSICVRHVSADDYSTQTTTTLTVGGVSADFVSTTQADPGGAPDTTPDAFSFTPQTDVPLLATVTSEVITVAGIDAPASITVSHGSYAIDGGDFTTSPGTVGNGQSVAVQHSASGECLGTVTTILTIGGVEGSFTSTTLDDTIDSDGDGVSDCLDDTPHDPASASPVVPGGTLNMSTSAGDFSGIQILVADEQGNQAGRPAGMDFPYGLASYEVTGLTPGATVAVTLTYPATLPAGTRVFKYSDAAGFEEFAGAVIQGDNVILTLEDGGAGDADGAVNGTIVDPVGVAAPASESSRRRSGGGALSWLMLTLLGTLALRRRRSHQAVLP